MSGNACRIKFSNPEVYDSWKTHFLTSDEWNNPDIFKNAKIYIKGRDLTVSERITLLKSIQEEIRVEGEESGLSPEDVQETVEFLDSLINSYGAMTEKKHYTKVVTSTSFTSPALKAIKNPLSVTTELGAFIPIVSSKINAYITDFLFSKFKEACIWDEVHEVMIDSDDVLTMSLDAIKAEFLGILQEYTGQKFDLGTSLHMSDIQLTNYEILLQEAWKKIQVELTTLGNIIDVEPTTQTLKNIINPITAFYVLQNFDSVIGQILPEFVVIDPAYKDSTLWHPTKYKRRQKERKNFSYNSDHHSADGDNLTDHLLITFVSNVMADGKPLDKGFIDSLYVKAVDWYENTILKQSRKDTDDARAVQIIGQLLTDESLSMASKIELFIELMETDSEFTSDLGQTRCLALASRLEKYQNAYTKQYQSTVSSRRAEMDINNNVAAKLINQFTSKGALALAQVRNNSEVQYIQAGNKKKSKEGIRKQFQTALTNALSDPTNTLFAKGLMIGNTSADWILQITSPSVIRYLSQITGFTFSDKDLLDRFKDSPLTITKFVRAYRQIVQDVLKSNNNSDPITTILNKLSENTAYIAFSNILVNENDYHLERMFDAEGKEQPKTTINTVTTQLSKAISRFKKSGFEESYNVLTKNNHDVIRRKRVQVDDDTIIPQGDFIQHINYAGDVEINGESTKWVDLTECQLFEVWVNSLYVDSIIKKQVFSYQIDAASDKPRVPIGSINAHDYYQMTIEQLVNARRTQSFYYYQQVEKSILDKWKTLFADDVQHGSNIASKQSLKQLAEYIQNPNNGITLDVLTNKLVKVQATNPRFTFQAQIDYIAQKNGSIVMNNSLLAEIDYASSKDKYLARSRRAFNAMLQNLDRYKPQIRIPSVNSLSEEEATRLADLLGVEKSALEKTIESINRQFDRNNKEQQAFLAKWFHMYNLFREADTELFQKHYWAHGKNDSNIIDEETGRINKSKKRNNALSATFSTLQQGLKYGVPSQIRTITIEALQYEALNHFGQTTRLSAHDGAIFSTYIMRLLERYSSQDVYVSDVTKIIALGQAGAGFEQIKCADYAMTNSWIRGTIKQQSGLTQHFDGRMLMEQMLSPAKFSTSNNIFFQNWRNTKDKNIFKLLGTDNPIVYFSGKPAVLNKMEPTETGSVYMQWKYLDTGNVVANSVVQSTLGLNTDENGYFILDSLYDLWKAFGAEYSCSTSDDGTIVFDDISQQLVALMICEFDPSLKFQMIGKAIDENASKSTMQFKNSRQRLFDGEPMVTGTLDTSSYGVQQDTSHLSEEDEISSLTQVINAIALNGENPEIVQEMYEMLGSITAQAIYEVLDIENQSNKTDFYIKLGKSIYQQLSRNKVVSNAQVILSKALQKVIPHTTEFAQKGLPISSNQLYHFVTSELLSKLNRIIKQKFAGTAVVQNPAQGIVGVYEDKQGRVYTRTEILKKAFDWARANKLKKTSYDDIVKAYLNANADFTPEVITKPQSLNIGHVVSFVSRTPLPSGKEDVFYSPSIHIESPKQLREIQQLIANGEEAVQIFSQQRNLTTTNIWWEDEVDSEGNVISNGSNIWSIGSMNALLAAEPNSSEAKAALAWHRANLRALQEDGGYFKTEEDFNRLQLTKVRNITRKSGEEVLPKYYKSKLGLEGSLADIKIAKRNHFIQLAEQRINPHPELSIKKYVTLTERIDKGKGRIEEVSYNNSFIVTTNTIDIVFYSDPSESRESNVIIEKDGNNRVIIDEYGNKIDNINVPNIDAVITLQSRDKGKSTLFFNVLDANYLNSMSGVLSLINSVKNVNGVFNDKNASDFWYKGVKGPDGKKQPNPLGDWLERTKALQSRESLEMQAEKAYQSFLLTLRTISARIPSQSFQSFLPNETVAFTESEENNGYMNIWEMWFQGSDYDIDKAYTMMFALNSSGVIEGNVFTDYSSPDSIMKSLLLPNPDSKAKIEINAEKGLDITKDIISFIKEVAVNGKNTVNDFTLDDWRHLLQIIQGNVKLLKHGQVLSITQGGLSPESFEVIRSIIERTNLYHDVNNYSETYFKNKVMATIRFASEDLRNLQASEVPMDAQYVNDRIDKSVSQVGTGNNETQYINEDPTHIINFQFQAAIGKKGVGISANAIKATGSIQQNANQKHLSGQSSPDFNLDLTFTIHKNIDGEQYQYTIHEPLRYVPNSKFTDFLQFRNMYRDVLDTSNPDNVHPLMKFFQSIQDGTVANVISDKQQKMVDAYNTLVASGFNPTLDQVLFYLYQTEENTADMISIFISLCTDNAKELQLYRIAGTPELLNIPLSLISLGMTVQDATDICVQYLIPVLDQLNVGVGQKAKSIPQIIDDLSKNGPESLRMGYESLKSVLKVANELKTLTGYFKINQGTSVKYAEVLGFLNRMDSLIQEIGADLGYTKVSMLDLLMTDEEASSNPELKNHFMELHADPTVITEFTMDNLRQDFIDNYEAKQKAAFNILELIFKAPHYFAQLRATAHMVKAIENNIGVANISSNIYSKMMAAKSDITSTKITQVVQNVCFGNALQTMQDIVFSKDGTVRKYGNWNPQLSDQAYIGVSTQVQINNLLDFVKQGLIPEIKKRFKGNFFVESLVIDPHTGHYTLPFNSYESKADMRIKQDINKTIFAFSQISGHDSGLRTLYDEVITIGDLLQMYSNIISQNRTNTMSSIIHAGTTNVSALNFQGRLSDYYAELDRITGIASTPKRKISEEGLVEWEAAKARLEEITSQAYNYVRAVDAGGEYTLTFNEGGISSKSVVYHVDLDDKTSIYSMTPGVLKTTLGMEYTESIVSNAVRVMLKSSHTGASLVSSGGDTGVTLFPDHIEFTVNIPSKTGRSNTKSFSYPITLIDNKISQAQLSGLQKAISYNIGSVYQNVQQLLTNQNATVHQNAKLSKCVPEFKAILDKFSNEFKDDPLYQELVKWSNQVFPTILELDGGDYVRTHIDKYGTENILILSKADFNDAIVPKDKQLRLLLNLMLDSNIEGLPSENKRFRVLLNKLGISKGFLHNLTFAIRQKNVQDKLKACKLGKMYYENLVEFSIDQEVKKAAYTTVQQLSRALTHADKYFYDVSDIPLSNVQIGDVLLDQTDDSKYLIVGTTKDSELIMVNMSPEQLGKVKLSYRVTTDGNLHLIQRLKLHSNHSMGVNSVKMPTEMWNVISGKPESIHALSRGDSFAVQDNWYTVTDVLYYKKGPSYITEYVIVDNNGIEQIFTEEMASSITQYAILSSTPMKSESLYRYIPNLDKLDSNIKYLLLKEVGYGSKIKFKEGNEVVEETIRAVEREHIVTTSNKIIPLNKIISCQYSDEHVLKMDPLVKYAIQSDWIRVHGLDFNPDFLLLPEMRLGVNILSKPVADEVADYIEPSNHLFIDPEVTKVSKQYNTITKGDYIVAKDHSFFFHILQISGNQALVSKVDSKKEYTLMVIPLSDLYTMPYPSDLYKRFEDGTSRIQLGQNIPSISSDEMAVILLNKLSETFGTNVKVDTFEGVTDKAFIQDGTVCINIPSNLEGNISDYILQQGLHEFTHLALVALRAKDPDTYAKLIASIGSVIRFNNNEDITMVEQQIYDSKTKQIEEYLVRAITEGIQGKVSLDEDVLFIIKNELVSILGGENANLDINDIDLLKTVRVALDAISDFTVESKGITLNDLRSKALSEDILDKVTYKCE